MPRHTYDPEGGTRSQGRTEVYRVGETEDVLTQRYDWFSQRLFLFCHPGGETVVARVGPWHRGHDPRADHLALAFSQAGRLIKRYSTLDIAGGEKAVDGGLWRYRNVSASVSHYSVFASGPADSRLGDPAADRGLGAATDAAKDTAFHITVGGHQCIRKAGFAGDEPRRPAVTCGGNAQSPDYHG